MAGGNFGGEDNEPLTGINVTPLVDVTLVLLIIFMVTTPMIMKPSINVNFPKAGSADQTAPAEFNVTITKDGVIYANGDKVSESALKTKSIDLVTKKPDVQ